MSSSGGCNKRTLPRHQKDCLLETIDFPGHWFGEEANGHQDDNCRKFELRQDPRQRRRFEHFGDHLGITKSLFLTMQQFRYLYLLWREKADPNSLTWGDAQERAYHSLKVVVTSRAVLCLSDIGSRFVLRTNGYVRGLGAVLMQRSQDKLYPVAYASKKLSSTEKKCA
ncbi:Zinc finger protein [Plakobranchus ocellatus]|uniref:Zinc finger protein n=1 Tax=Plakobranchus ocellatus TaxID=259542 RepID=A0AAV4DXR9_9GAST|nr:Zinc finger protein [Plakobranchus ocellatus]